MNKSVSIIIPTLNEENNIEPLVNNLLAQSYPKELQEWIFVDGGSSDLTQSIIMAYAEKITSPHILLLKNPKRIPPSAMNIGIKNATGEIIVRLDAHANYNEDYIEKCVYHLMQGECDNVGGVAETVANGFIGSAIAKLLSSRFGVGNSKFRISDTYIGYVDTVPFGTFRKDLFDKIGLFDERLPRSEDNEINYRIRKNGGKVLLSSDIRFRYYARDNVKSLIHMAYVNGCGVAQTTVFCPGTMRLRHYIPFLFFLSIVLEVVFLHFSNIVFWLFKIEIVMYSLCALYFSKCADSCSQRVIVFFLYPIFHLSYGYGTMHCFLEILKNKIKGIKKYGE